MHLEEKQKHRENERGVTLLIALITLLIVSLLGAGIIFVTRTETATSANYAKLMQARYAAEAGVQSTINWLSNNYTAPTSFASYTMSTNPVQCASGCTTNGNPVVLSGMTGVSSNYPDSTVASAYNTALNNQFLPGPSNVFYSTYATLLTMDSNGSQTGQITSQGTAKGLSTANIQLTATYERIQAKSSLFKYAVFGTSPTCGSVIFSGGGGTNSFDSSAGTYAATQQLSNGNIGSNGNFNLSGGGGTAPIIKTISGTLNTPKSGVGTCSSGSPNAETVGSGWTTGALTQLPAPVAYPAPTMPTPAPPTTAQDIRNNCSGVSGCSCYPSGGYACTNSGPYQLTPGTYGNLNLSGGKTLHLSAGTYNVNSINISGGGFIVIDSGPVLFYPAGQGILAGSCCAVNLSGGSISNPGGIPANFQIMTASAADITLSGGAGNYGVVYAPNSGITISGGGDLYGAVVGSTINNSGGTSIHYDRALGNIGTSSTPTGFHMINFSWSKY